MWRLPTIKKGKRNKKHNRSGSSSPPLPSLSSESRVGRCEMLCDLSPAIKNWDRSVIFCINIFNCRNNKKSRFSEGFPRCRFQWKRRGFCILDWNSPSIVFKIDFWFSFFRQFRPRDALEICSVDCIARMMFILY